jgi:hypothetical protein
MTTEAAERAYLADHIEQWRGKGYAVFNPQSRPIEELPVIYGFNNGGSPGWMSAQLISEDGEELGGHVCSHEGYMPHDLGIVEDSRPDRHEGFRKHYPDGYRMDFVSYGDVDSHPGLQAAFKLHDERYPDQSA